MIGLFCILLDPVRMISPDLDIAKNAVRKRIAVPAWRISIVSELEANALCKTLVSSDLERFKIVMLG